MPQEDSLKRLGRIVSILCSLNDGSVRLRDVVTKHRKDKRTIHRDFAMIHRAGFCVQTDNAGTYKFAPGVSLSNPGKLTQELQTAFSSMAAFALNSGTPSPESFSNVLRSIFATDAMGDSPILHIMPRVLKENIPFINDFEYAIEYSKELEIEFQKEPGVPIKKHTICPLKLLMADGSTYVFCTYKGKPTIFPKYRLNRIKKVRIIEGDSFPTPAGMEEALNAHSIWGVQKKSERKVKVKLVVKDFAREYFRLHELVEGQKVREQKDGSLTFEARIGELPEMIPHVLRWMPHVTVIAPQELKDEVRKRLEDYAKNQK
ncbi:MAG: WYL domain-containing protein [Elusimicrobiota bacterium]|nr:WYL domain-containing protein [Elusimicrobiota bacterium]